jgi:hypothetical protein
VEISRSVGVDDVAVCAITHPNLTGVPLKIDSGESVTLRLRPASRSRGD